MERITPEQVLRHRAGDGDNRDGVHQSVNQTGDEIGGAGAGSGHTDADFSGGAGEAFRGEGSVLFVADENVLHRMIVKNVGDGQRDTAGISEDNLGAFAPEGFEQNL